MFCVLFFKQYVFLPKWWLSYGDFYYQNRKIVVNLGRMIRGKGSSYLAPGATITIWSDGKFNIT